MSSGSFSYTEKHEHTITLNMDSIDTFLIIAVCPDCKRPVEFRICHERGSKKRLDGHPDKGIYLVITCNECGNDEWDYSLWGEAGREEK